MSTSQHSFIGRQPIVNSQQEIIVYEFFFKNEATDSNTPVKEDIQTCAKILSTTIDEMHESWLLGQQLAFISVDNVMLNSEFLELMPAEKTVLEIVHTVEVTPEAVARCIALKQSKFKLALDNPQQHPQLEALIPYADYVKLDMRDVDPTQAKRLLQKYQTAACKRLQKKWNKMRSLKACWKQAINIFRGTSMLSLKILPARSLTRALMACCIC